MKKTKRTLLALLLTGALAVMTGCGSQSAEIRFGTAGTGGTYYAYGTAMSELLSARLENASFDVKTTAGSAANLRLLSEDYLQLAIAQSDMTGDAWTGEGVFAGQTPRSGYGAVASLYTEPCQLVARADAGIRSVADLRGKTVSVGQDESGVVQNAEQILLAYGLSFTMLHVRTDLSYSDAAAALADGTIDAFFCTAGAPTNAVANLARQTDVVLVGLESDKVDSLLDTYGDYAACTIPAGTYEGQDEDVETIGVRALLLASSKLSEDRVYQITAALFENADALQMATAADTPLSLEDAPEGVTIPFHSGAAKFYAEKGITVEVSE